jgi:hypothetical protein
MVKLSGCPHHTHTPQLYYANARGIVIFVPFVVRKYVIPKNPKISQICGYLL